MNLDFETEVLINDMRIDAVVEFEYSEATDDFFDYAAGYGEPGEPESVHISNIYVTIPNGQTIDLMDSNYSWMLDKEWFAELEQECIEEARAQLEPCL